MRPLVPIRQRLIPLVVGTLGGLLACSAPISSGSKGAAAATSGTGGGTITEGDVRRLLGAISDDSLEGRMTATRGSARAAALIAAEMRRIGLAPAGDSGYFQRVPIGLRAGGSRPQPVLFESFAALDSLPPNRRPSAVNVVGVLRGSDPLVRDSAVLIDAHYDHLGIGRPVNGDSIYNGADDDASGVVAVLEIARALAAGPAPRRTVIFAATTGEEVGLLGTRWYLRNPVVPIAQMSANLEIEMIGRPDSLAGGAGRAWLTGFERSTMGETFARAGLPIVADRRLDQQFFERSDNIAFARMGVPAHTLSSYNMHSDYHEPSDDLSHVDIAHMTAVIRAGAAAARLLADGPAPHWNANGRPMTRPAPRAPTPTPMPVTPAPTIAGPDELLARFTTVRLEADTASLTVRERRMLPLLIDAAREMHDLFWIQVVGPRDSVLASISDPAARRLADVLVGPWDRLANNAPFVAGVGPKPAGANFYPRDMTKAEFERAVQGGGARADSLKSLYTMIRRDAAGSLVAIPYSRYFASANEGAATKVRAAAALADDAGLRRYLTALATALVTDRYRSSDLAWMDMKRNRLDIVLGPIETYEDELFGYKAAQESFVLIKDLAWSRRLAKYAAMLPSLQRGIPVPDAYKRERPGTDADLNAYDVVYVSGQANAGVKTIAINLPNDEVVQLQKGARRLQLKNAVRAKFDRILMPIARELIAADQLPHVTFDAFFENVMFHEVAHGLGIKNTIDGKGTVRAALKERYSALEEGKADILGLYMLRQLNARGELGNESMEDNYVTFLASLFRSVRFGASDSHGRANVVAFNFLKSQGAFARGADGKFRVDFAKMRAASDSLSRRILVLQGDGDYAGVGRLNAELGAIDATLQGDLDRLKAKGIPVDVLFDQGR
jgi:hypothetical protein